MGGLKYTPSSEPITGKSVDHSLATANHGLGAVLDCAKNIVVSDIIIGIDSVRNRGGAVAKDGIARKVGHDTETGLNLVLCDVNMESHYWYMYIYILDILDIFIIIDIFYLFIYILFIYYLYIIQP